MSKWLKGCEICNAGLITEVDRLVESGISVNKACKLMAQEGERKIGAKRPLPVLPVPKLALLPELPYSCKPNRHRSRKQPSPAAQAQLL